MIIPLLTLSISKLCFLLSKIRALKTMHVHTNTWAARRATQNFWMSDHWGTLLLNSRTANLDPNFLAFTESIRSIAEFLKPSSTFSKEKYTLYFINTQVLCWLTLQKWSGWEASPKNILTLFFTFLFFPNCILSWEFAR